MNVHVTSNGWVWMGIWFPTSPFMWQTSNQTSTKVMKNNAPKKPKWTKLKLTNITVHHNNLQMYKIYHLLANKIYELFMSRIAWIFVYECVINHMRRPTPLTILSVHWKPHGIIRVLKRPRHQIFCCCCFLWSCYFRCIVPYIFQVSLFHCTFITPRFPNHLLFHD